MVPRYKWMKNGEFISSTCGLVCLCWGWAQSSCKGQRDGTERLAEGFGGIVISNEAMEDFCVSPTYLCSYHCSTCVYWTLIKLLVHMHIFDKNPTAVKKCKFKELIVKCLSLYTCFGTERTDLFSIWWNGVGGREVVSVVTLQSLRAIKHSLSILFCWVLRIALLSNVDKAQFSKMEFFSL